MITCTKCGVSKLEEEFHVDRKYKTGRFHKCKECRNAEARLVEALKREIPTYKSHKLCTICKKCLPALRYLIKKDFSLPGACLLCSNEQARITYKHKQRHKKFSLLIRAFKTHKQCPHCKKCLPNSAYAVTKLGLLNSPCKICILETARASHRRRTALRKGKLSLPMYETHSLCNKCKECLPISAYNIKSSGALNRPCKKCGAEYKKIYIENNREAIKLRMRKWYDSNKEARKIKDAEYRHLNRNGILEQKKKYRLENIDKFKEKDRKYREKNKDKIDARKKEHVRKNKVKYTLYYREYNRKNREKRNAQNKEWRSSKANFLPMGPKLFPEDRALNADGMMRVRCKNCKNHFQPTNSQCAERIKISKTLLRGDGNFYCSEKCKKECDIFGRLMIPKSLQPIKNKSRILQKKIKKDLLKTQCKEVGYNYCEKCQDILDVDIHHTFPLSVFTERDEDNPDSMLLLCPGCHVELHRSC